MPSGKKRKLNTKECPACGHTNTCTPCVQRYDAAMYAKKLATERQKYAERKAKYEAMGLNSKGRIKKSGWKAGPSLVLTTEKLSPIPDEECFEAPYSITTRELKFLI